MFLSLQVGADEDVKKAKDSKNIRRGKGKMRNRRYVSRKGPLVVYGEDSGLAKAFRNIPGVDCLPVTALNILQVPPPPPPPPFPSTQPSRMQLPRMPVKDSKPYNDIHSIMNCTSVELQWQSTMPSAEYLKTVHEATNCYWLREQILESDRVLNPSQAYKDPALWELTTIMVLCVSACPWRSLGSFHHLDQIRFQQA